MRIEHIAFWVGDLEVSKNFYEKYFGGVCNDLYTNPSKRFSSYFISFPESEVRLELMYCPDVPGLRNREYSTNPEDQHLGLIHFAVSLGSKEQVVRKTEQLRSEGIVVISEPRTTGDGYYESVVLDPDGNMIELTI